MVLVFIQVQYVCFDWQILKKFGQKETIDTPQAFICLLYKSVELICWMSFPCSKKSFKIYILKEMSGQLIYNIVLNFY